MRPIPYICPETREALRTTTDGLMRQDGLIYPFIRPAAGRAAPAPNFGNLTTVGSGQRDSLEMYNTEAAVAIYRNFLDWLFETFAIDEAGFRHGLVQRLRLSPGQSVLVTGCGLGDDIGAILDMVGPEGQVHAQDLSPAMVLAAANYWEQHHPSQAQRISFSAGNAQKLPYADHSFDAAFHFGGINLYDDLEQGIAEMNRVVRPGGRVVVGDEGVAPWLRKTKLGQMVIANIRLWDMQAPLDKIPTTATDVAVSWVLGNCFWVIEFTVTDSEPYLNPHVVHKGRRGGSMWTRFHGQLEGVSSETKERVGLAAEAAGLSVHDWLEQAIAAHLASPSANISATGKDSPKGGDA